MQLNGYQLKNPRRGFFDKMSREEGSNLRPAVYDTAALPTELSRQDYLPPKNTATGENS